MEFSKYIFVLLLIVVASFQQVAADDDDKPFLRIVAPQYICDAKTNASVDNSNNDNKLTIGLQTREGQRLRYAIAIDFNILDGFKSQRHTLSIWKAVRELQAKFQVKKISDEITLKNQIEIDALEVIYIFNSFNQYFSVRCL